MDLLSATASVIVLLQLSTKVLAYLNDIKDAPKGHAQCVKQALETLQAKITDGGRLKKALTWKFKKEEVYAILARMERIKSLIEIALQMDHFKISKTIKDNTDLICTGLSAIQSAADKASQRSLLEWISSSDYPAQQSDIIKRRQEGTGQWFLDAPEVARWLSEAKATLFCPGIPGAGKTMVAAIAIDYVLNSAQNSVYGVGYHACSYPQAARSRRPSALGLVKRLYEQHVRHATRPSLDDIFSALRDAVAQYPYVFIVVDALDECQRETRRQLLSKLLALQEEADVRLIVTSRFVPDVEDTLRLAIRLEVKASNEDVKQFVVGQIDRLPRCVQRNKASQDLVQEKVVEAVDGM
ncbi:hypothetical protein GQ44DRAFT_815540 [Phaeosphaeriaceae sp. PMI808]|nr:hypothetical protein GQ44DRAFT_815540 [Phaeosphaeriaceae sp. PMI808]